MTDEQFIQLMQKMDSLWMLIFLGILVMVLGIGWLVGGQR
jgi:hypothetical protein